MTGYSADIYEDEFISGALGHRLDDCDRGFHTPETTEVLKHVDGSPVFAVICTRCGETLYDIG